MAGKSRLSDCGVSRRDMIRIGAGGLGFGLLGGIGPVPFVLNRATLEAAAEESGKILVVFEWFGGNDGLNTIVPYGDPMYYKHRPTIGIKERDLLKIDAQFGWHKSMRGMKQLYDEGKVAIVQGVGYDQPSFSHFTSVSFWHTAAPNSGNEYGWFGRTASALDPAGTRDNMIVNISDSQTLAVKGENHVPLVFVDPTRFQRGVFAQEKSALDALGAPRPNRSATRTSTCWKSRRARHRHPSWCEPPGASTEAKTIRTCASSIWTRWRRSSKRISRRSSTTSRCATACSTRT